MKNALLCLTGFGFHNDKRHKSSWRQAKKKKKPENKILWIKDKHEKCNKAPAAQEHFEHRNMKLAAMETELKTVNMKLINFCY